MAEARTETRSLDPRGKIALVTGANRGIGRAIVDALLEAGAARVYAGTRQTMQGWPAAVTPVSLDITDPASVAAGMERCGDVQILVNNAGVSYGQPLLGASDPEAAAREMQVNYFGTLRMCRVFAPILARNGGGAIVNVLSILARMGAPGVGSYSASKAAALSLTQSVRGELTGQGTRVIGVMPALVDTDMAKRLSLPKLPPRAVAEEIIAALRAGTEDVYPGEQAAAVAQQLQQDSKAVERQFAAAFARRQESYDHRDSRSFY